MTKIYIRGFDTDSRGNKLLTWAARTVGTGTQLYVCAPSPKVAKQVEICLPPGAVRIQLEDEEIRQDCTNAWEFFGTLPSMADEMLAVLREVLTLQDPVGMLAIALDFYKDPEETEAGTLWHDTIAGAMVNRAKYWASPVVQEEAWNDMAKSLSSLISRHPALRTADVIVSVPGHDTTNWSVSETVAQRTAALAGLPFVRTGAKHAQRPEAKGEGERVDLSHEFDVVLPASARVVLVVDDVMKSGDTMNAVRLAAKRAGAEHVYGLVCARTRRKR